MLRRALAEIAEFDGLLIVHAEDPWKIYDGARPGPDYAAYEASRPPAAETTAITLVIDGMREMGTRVHILHLSSAEALPLIRAAKAEGLPLTVETCPHHLTFDAADLLHRNRVSAFDGRVLLGEARATWVGGVQVHGVGAEPIAEGGSPVGKLLTRPWRSASKRSS